MMSLKEQITSIIQSAVRDARNDGILPEALYPPVKVEYPREEKFGDYSSPFAMECAKILKKNPALVAEMLKPYIEKQGFIEKQALIDEISLIEKVEIVKPGFINIYIAKNYLYTVLEEIVRNKENYGRRIKEKPLTVNIEFVSANPTGPMNIVSARAAAIGDTIANLIEASGDVVDREFYVNDYGNQVQLLGESVLARMKEYKAIPVEFPADGYHGEYIRDIAGHIMAEYPDIDLDDPDSAGHISMLAVEYNVSGQKKDLEGFNVFFKNWFRESTLHESGEVESTFTLLAERSVIYEQENKKLFRSTGYGDDKDRVVIRDDGRPTYLLADIAYHKNKLQRGYDKIINIWGPDHHGYIARLSGAMTALGASEGQFTVLIAQQVNLVLDGETVKMSKRLGNFSTMKELLEEIGTDVARYFFVMRSLDSHLDFDLALAKKESSENPVFYLQYAHARICSIFAKAEDVKIAYSEIAINREYLDNIESLMLIKSLMKFPEEVFDSAENLEPHRIAAYLMRLAASFHRFYTSQRIISENKEQAATLLRLADAVRIVMKNGLGLLGVSAPERM